jgi:hypothetical protein
MVLDHESGLFPVVVPSEQRREVSLAREGLVGGAFEPEPIGRVIERGDFDEDRGSVVEGRAPAPVRRRAMSGDRL